MFTCMYRINFGNNWLWFCASGSQLSSILYSGWKYLDFNEFTHRIRLLSCARSWLAFSVCWRSRLDFSVSTKSIWLLCRWESELTWFQWSSRLQLCFWRGYRNCRISYGHQNLPIFCPGRELIVFLCAGRSSFGFHVWVENILVSACVMKMVYGVDIDWIAFRVHGGNWLGFRLRAEVTSFWCEHRPRFRFTVGRRNWLDFNARHQNWLLLSVGIGLDMVFVCRRWTCLCLCMVAENHPGLAWASKCWPSCAGRKLLVLDLLIKFTFF